MKIVKYILIIYLLLISLSVKGVQTTSPIILSKKELKEAVFSDDRIFFEVVTDNEDTLSFFTDTGGGNIIFPEAVDILELKTEKVSDGDEHMEVVRLDKWLINKGYPPTKGPHYVFEDGNHMEAKTAGLLGASWFADKAWEFNYIDERVFLIDSLDWNKSVQEYVFPLYFLKEGQEVKQSDFPRVPIVVGKDTIQMLFDTGATLALTSQSKAYFNTASSYMGISFIIESIFLKWREENPDWNYIEDGENRTNFPMIEVPKVKIGNEEVGPVWFVSRPDKNFTIGMSQYMDREIQGAIGGSCFRYFSSIIVDYNSEKILLKK